MLFHQLTINTLSTAPSAQSAPMCRLTADVLGYHGIPFAQAVAAVRQSLPQSATLVGQNIGRDVEWLQLKEGVDFKACTSPLYFLDQHRPCRVAITAHKL